MLEILPVYSWRVEKKIICTRYGQILEKQRKHTGKKQKGGGGQKLLIIPSRDE